jgi:hypothetical protein
MQLAGLARSGDNGTAHAGQSTSRLAKAIRGGERPAEGLRLVAASLLVWMPLPTVAQPQTLKAHRRTIYTNQHSRRLFHGPFLVASTFSKASTRLR